METIKLVLLHEYTHWDKLMAPVLPSSFSTTSTVDYSYGAFLTRLENKLLAPELAIRNGDSYPQVYLSIYLYNDQHGQK